MNTLKTITYGIWAKGTIITWEQTHTGGKVLFVLSIMVKGTF